jgi:hypothetical protein
MARRQPRRWKELPIRDRIRYSFAAALFFVGVAAGILSLWYSDVFGDIDARGVQIGAPLALIFLGVVVYSAPRLIEAWKHRR